MKLCRKHFIPQIILALCLSAVFQFIACAQANSDDSKAPQTEQNSSAQTNADSAHKLIENSKTTFDFSALNNQLLCSPNGLHGLFKLTAAQPTQPAAPIAKPKVQLLHPQVAVHIRPHDHKLHNVSFAQPEQHSKHAPRTFRATAYALKGRTRSGAQTKPGVIAADPRVLPLGTVVQVNAGQYSGVYTVHDTGGRIKGDRLDVWVPSKKEARSFGRRNVKLVVLRYPAQNKPEAQK
jgi:3D (Asp-Asp-Asp) domain-containing protein